MTFSIVARAEQGAWFGVAIASSSPAVASRCSYAKSRRGAVATQNVTNPALGPAVLVELEHVPAPDAVNRVFASEPHRDFRQLLAIGCTGSPAIRSGSKVLGIHGDSLGQDAAAAGNLLARSSVPAAMVQAFEQAGGEFPTRLLAALRAGLDEGGEAGPVHSAGLYVVRDMSWPVVDLRVDWADQPIDSLAAAWMVFERQLEDYVRRAIDPQSAPSYHVAGDL